MQPHLLKQFHLIGQYPPVAFRGLASPDSPLADQPGDPLATAIEHGSHLADFVSSLFHRGLSWGRLYTLPLEPLHLAGGNPLVTGPGAEGTYSSLADQPGNPWLEQPRRAAASETL